MFNYNHKIKIYPDGTIQHIIYGDIQEREYKKESSIKVSSSKRKEFDNFKRAKQTIYDIARSNNFNYFITLTFDSSTGVDRYDYKSCCDALKVFTKHLTYKKCSYIIVPEKHKDGAFHFHGLLSGDIKLSQAFNPHNGLPIKNVFNIDNFDFGFSTASFIRHKDKVSSYITKYITKELLNVVPKGCKRYWASKGLNRPIVAFDMELLTPQQIFWLDVQSDYRTESHSIYGDYYLFEYRP